MPSLSLHYITGAEAKEEVAVVVVVVVEVGAVGEARASEWPEASLRLGAIHLGSLRVFSANRPGYLSF